MKEPDRPRTSSSSHSLIPALFFFAALATAFLAPVLFGDRALLPTDFLMRMSPWAQTLPPAGAPGATARPELPWNPLLWDSLAQFYPWRAFTALWLRRGILPFWDPHQFCGTPFLANSQSAPLYPLHLLLLGLPTGLSVARAMAYLAAIHLTLAGFFTSLWLRALRLSPFAALLGGITFMLSGFAVTWLELPSFLTVACWLPLLFLTVHRTLDRPTGRRAASVAITVGLILLGGHLQIAFYCLLGVGLYTLDRLWQRVRSEPRRADVFLSVVCCLLPAALLGVMLAAPQLLPAIELSRHSHRVTTASAAGYAAYVRGAMPSAQLIRLLLPDFFGNPTHDHYLAGSPADYIEFGAFIGGVGLLLALCGLLAWRRRPRETVPAAVIAALSLLLALGTPLNKLLYFGIPGFSQSGSPARVLVLFCFAGAWLAALGAEALFGMRDEEYVRSAVTRMRDEGRPAAEEASSHISRPSSQLYVDWLPWVALTVWLILLGAALWSAQLFVASHGDDFALFMARSGPALQLGVVMAVLAIGVPIALKRLSGTGSVSSALAGSMGRAVLATLLLGELWLYGAGFNPMGPLSEVYPTPPLITALRSGPAAGTGRILPLNHHWSLSEHPHAVLPPNSALALGLADPQGYDSLFIGRYKGFTNLLVPGGDSAPPQNGNMLFLWDPRSPLLPLLAADRVVIQWGGGVSEQKPVTPIWGSAALARLRIRQAEGRRSSASAALSQDSRTLHADPPDATLPPGATWSLLYEEAGLRVYHNLTALPRAFVATSWRTARDEAAMVKELQHLAGTHGLGTTALVEGPTGRVASAGRGGTAAVQEVSPNEVRITLDRGAAPGMLVLLDDHYPGWHATDEATGRPLPIHRADLTFRAIPVEEGSRSIRLQYEPATFRLGLFLALLAIASIAALCMVAGVRGSTQPDGGSLQG